jgi:hypothetical protein
MLGFYVAADALFYRRDKVAVGAAEKLLRPEKQFGINEEVQLCNNTTADGDDVTGLGVNHTRTGVGIKSVERTSAVSLFM